MTRLPQPGADEGSWGVVLNDFLATAHNADGTLKASSISSLNAETSTNKGQPNGYASLDGSGKVPASQLPPASTAADATTTVKGVVRLAGDLAGTADAPTVVGLAGKYVKPVAGIPEADLTTAVQTKLNAPATVTDATTTTKGSVQLAGDLAGTADAPTVVGLSGKYVKPVAGIPETDLSSAVQTKLNTTATSLDDLSDVSANGATDGQVLLYQAGTWGPATNSAGGTGTVSDATTSAKGIIQLGGDLAGTAGAPTVVGLSGKYVKPVAGIPETDLTAAAQAKLNNTVDTTAVHLTGAETVGGVKTFSSSPVVPTPTTGTQVANKTYVDTAVAGVTGGNGQTAVARTANYTAVAGDFVIGNAAAGSFTVTLPTPENGAFVSVKKTDSSANGIIVSRSGILIDDLASVTVGAQWQSQDFFSDGTKWYRV